MEPPSTTRSTVNNRSYIGRNEPTFIFRTDPSSSCFSKFSSTSTLDLDKISVVQKSRRKQRGGGRNKQIDILTKTLPLHRLILIAGFKSFVSVQAVEINVICVVWARQYCRIMM